MAKTVFRKRFVRVYRPQQQAKKSLNAMTVTAPAGGTILPQMMHHHGG